MNEQSWEHLVSVLVDTGVFICWFRGDREAQRFFRDPERNVYYAKVTRKELLREPIRASEADRLKAFLARFRLIIPDQPIAARFSELLRKYEYLKGHPADALIAATAWEKRLPLLTVNARHFVPIQEITLHRFLPAGD